MMTVAQFSARLMQLMPKLMREIHAYERNFFTQSHLTLPQLWALDFLREHSGCTMREFARAMHNRESTATGLVDRMVRMKLVRRERSRADRRVVRVFLSENGQSVVRQIHRQRLKMTERLFRRMGERDRRQYLDILERLVRQFARAPARGGR